MPTSRRVFLTQACIALAPRSGAADLAWAEVEPHPSPVTRTWLGPAFWANRLQDWRLHEGRLECVAGDANSQVRTAALLTREILSRGPAHLRVRTGALEDAGGGGFSGFLIGAGAGRLDYRAAALVQKASGAGGGILCVWESDGRLRFREHTSEPEPLRYAELPAETLAPPAGPRPGAADILLQLDIEPQDASFCTLRLTARDASTGVVLGSVLRRGVAESEVLGGVLLVSSPAPGGAGTRYWFRDVATAGSGIAVRPERALGPILGTLHSLNGSVLKVTAQLMPVGAEESPTVEFQYRRGGGRWRDGPAAPIGPGFTALFRVENWDSTRDWEYRVVYQGHTYNGWIRRDPVRKPSLDIALFSCVMASYRSLEGGIFRPELPGERFLGRYTHQSLYFPHNELVRNAARHRPDLLAFVGDQLYQNSPTRVDQSAGPTLDYLYKWCLWLWAFRDLTRDTPAVVLVDDHDVYQGNIWGEGGRPAPEGEQERGGYVFAADWVNLVQRTQCGHNPDPYDDAPALQNISVYYGAFRYGGVSFAVVEDRKFKPGPRRDRPLAPEEVTLLGERQERFLAQWAKDPALAKICLSQTAWACVQTTPEGQPRQDHDSNGWPKPGRDRAIALLGEARAILLSGDQHLASVVRHQAEGLAGGVIQFSGPGGGTSFQRWFEPADPRPGGDFVDGFGNRIRVLAVANPKVSFRDYRRQKPTGQGLGDRTLKSEGYCIIRVRRRQREYVLECWPWDADPKSPGARQFYGWPLRVRFDEIV